MSIRCHIASPAAANGHMRPVSQGYWRGLNEGEFFEGCKSSTRTLPIFVKLLKVGMKLHSNLSWLCFKGEYHQQWNQMS